MTLETIELLILGLFAGVMSGMFGIGGGIIIVPALTVLLQFEQKEATGTSLAALLLPVGIFAVIAYHRAGKLKFVPALVVAAGLATGVWFGARVALDLNPDTLRKLYGIFLLVMGWRFAEPRKYLAERRGEVVPPPPPTTPPDIQSPRVLLMCALVGVFAGVLSGMFGIGGGIVIVPFLITMLHFDQKLATGTSLGALLLPVGLPGVLAYYNDGKLNIPTAIPVALGLAVGALFGARIALGLPAKTVKRLYGIFLFLVALKFLFG